MIRARRWSLGWLPVLAGLAAMAGCSHSCGYVEFHSVWTPAGEARVSTAPLVQPLRILREISDRNAVLEVQVESLETTEGLVQIVTYGRPVYVRWHWYAPLLKLPVAVTILPPFFLAFHDPQPHGAGNWNGWDYLYDVGAWYNLCSALPNGEREMRLQEQPVRSEKRMALIREQRAPIAGRSVLLSLDGHPLASGVSDAKGAVRFDLAPFLKPELAERNHAIRLVTLDPTGGAAQLEWTLDGKVVQQFLENQSAAPKPPALPPGP